MFKHLHSHSSGNNSKISNNNNMWKQIVASGNEIAVILRNDRVDRRRLDMHLRYMNASLLSSGNDQ